MIAFGSTESKGIEEEVLETVDSAVQQLFFAFKKALKDKIFLEPENACAEAYYQELVNVPELKELHPAMKRNYAVALQDDAQQVLNKLLEADEKELGLSKVSKAAKWLPWQ